MRKIIYALGGITLMLTVGCNGDFLKIDPAFAAPLVEKGAAITTTMGLKALVSDAEGFEKVKAVVKPVQEIIDTTVIPIIKGVDLADVTRATADKALALLNEKIPQEIKGVIQLAVNGAMTLLKMPDNPATKLEPGQVEIILALFRGIGTGASAFIAWGGPGAKALGDIPVVLEITWAGGRCP